MGVSYLSPRRAGWSRDWRMSMVCTQHTTEHRGVGYPLFQGLVALVVVEHCKAGELIDSSSPPFFRPCPLNSFITQAIIVGVVYEGSDGASPRGCG